MTGDAENNKEPENGTNLPEEKKEAVDGKELGNQTNVSEETPLLGKEKRTAKQNWAKVKAATHVVGSVNRMQRLRDMAADATNLARASTTSAFVHGEGEGPSEEEAAQAMSEFYGKFGLGIACVGLILFALPASLAFYFALAYPSGPKCAYPLSTILLILGAAQALNAILIFAMVWCPILLLLEQSMGPALNCVQTGLLILCLLTHHQATDCGQVIWWACLFLSNCFIGLCVCCCCSPTAATAGAGKAAALVATTYTKAPLLSTKATFPAAYGAPQV